MSSYNGSSHNGYVRRSDFLPFAPPSIGEEDIAEVVDTLRSGWITTGPKTKKFEQAFAAYLGVPDGLALNSCTAGLHIALAALGIGRGDEVITSTLTFAATVNVIEHIGAHPVLVDIEPDTLNISPEAAARAVTPRTRAILPVHFAGHPAEMDELMKLARAHGLEVIEDAAHAVAARYKGRLIGSGSNPTAFSFYATKNLTTGEGGMLTGNAEFLEEARVLSLHGMNRDAWKRYDNCGSWYYEIVTPGFKYNMTDIQASLGLRQLERLSAFQLRRAEIAEKYAEGFQDLSALELPAVRTNVDHAWHLYPIRLRLEELSINRDRFIEELRDLNIGASVHFIPVHMHPHYRDKYGYSAEDFPVAYGSYQRLVSLPMRPGLCSEDVADIIETVHHIVKKHRR